MSDRVFFPTAALAALVMIALAAVWPQGDGARSPGPFGRTPYRETAAARAELAQEAEAVKGRAPSPAVIAGLRPVQ